MDKLLEVCIPMMVQQGFTEEQATTYMRGKLPELKHWKSDMIEGEG